MSNSAVKNNLGTFYTNLGKNVRNVAEQTANSINSTLTNASKSLNSFGNSASKTINSLVPLTAKNNSLFGILQNQANNKTPSLITAAATNTAATSVASTWPVILFLIIIEILESIPIN